MNVHQAERERERVSESDIETTREGERKTQRERDRERERERSCTMSSGAGASRRYLISTDGAPAARGESFAPGKEVPPPQQGVDAGIAITDTES